MLSAFARRLARTDWGMFLIAAALLAAGLVMVYSSSYHFQLMGWADVTGPAYHFSKQLRFAGIGMVFLVITWLLDYHLYKRFINVVAILTGVTLLAMAFLGRWIAMTRSAGDIIVYGSIQPVEAAKIGAIIYIAVWLQAKGQLTILADEPAQVSLAAGGPPDPQGEAAALLRLRDALRECSAYRRYFRSADAMRLVRGG